MGFFRIPENVEHWGAQCRNPAFGKHRLGHPVQGFAQRQVAMVLGKRVGKLVPGPVAVWQIRKRCLRRHEAVRLR